MRAPSTQSAEEILASYVPRFRRQKILAESSLQQPSLARRFAAILFVDLVGFSALTEQFLRRGLIGAEQLSEVVNGYLGQTAEISAEHGGEIVHFAGDAAWVVWFVDEEPQLKEAALLAVQCALAVQQRLQHAPLSGISLSVRASIGAGMLSYLEVGGVQGEWHVLLAGGPVLDATAADRMARAGDVIVAASAWPLIRSRCLSTATSEVGVRVAQVLAPISPLPSAAATESILLPASLHGVVPSIVRARVAAGLADRIGEFRTLSIAFVNIEGLDYESLSIVDRLQPAISAAQACLNRFEGNIYQLLVDDKGTNLVVAFGLPPWSHEDDAARMVQALLALQEVLTKLGLVTSIGGTTGQLFCCVYGSESRRQYAIVGPMINLAARLMQARKGLLCEPATIVAARTHRELLTHDLPPLIVKGKAEPVAVFQPYQAAPRTSLEKPTREFEGKVVGRAAELVTLEQAIAALRFDLASGVIFIDGEPGIGKSTLARHAAALARTHQVRYLAGFSAEMESSTPYFAWRPIFLELLGLTVQSEAQVCLQQVRERLGSNPELQRLAPLLGEVLPLGLPDTEDTQAMSGEARAESTRNLLVALLGQFAAQHPTLLILEDAHWFDSSSWSLLCTTVESVRPLLVLVTTRPLGEQVSTAQRLLESPGCRRMPPKALSLEETSTVLASRLKVSGVQPEVASLVFERTAGNPFFTEELALFLREQGLVVSRGGEHANSPPREQAGREFEEALRKHGAPLTLQGTVIARIDRLDQQEQLTLRLASVLGHSFTMAALERLLPVRVEHERLREALGLLVHQEFLHSVPSTPEPTFTFKHAITRDVAYNTMSFADRRALHRRAAEWLEGELRENALHLYQPLAYHWREAGEQTKAIHYLVSAGEQAFRIYANREAVAFLSEALELAEGPSTGASEQRAPLEPARRARLELLLGKAYLGLSNYPQARARTEQGLTLLGLKPPESSSHLALGLLREALRQVLHRLWPERFVGRLSHRREWLLEAASAWEALVETHFYLGDGLRSLYAALSTLNLAEQAGPSAQLARGYAILGAITGFIPLHGVARSYGTTSLAVMERTQDLAARVWISIVVGVSRVGMGDTVAASALFEQVIPLAERLGDHRRLRDSMENLGILRAMSGEWDEALEYLRAMRESALRDKDFRYEVLACREQAYLLVLLGRWDEVGQAVEVLRRYLAQGLPAEEQMTRQDTHALAAALALHQGEAEAALREARAALALMASADPSTSTVNEYWFIGLVARVLLTLWEQSQSASNPWPWLREQQSVLRREAALACRTLQRHARVYRVGAANAQLLQGSLEWLAGRPRAARGYWQRSLALAQEHHLPYEKKLAQGELHRRANSDEFRWYGLFAPSHDSHHFGR